jgi:hypothetical protein
MGCSAMSYGRSSPTSILRVIALMMDAARTSDTLVNFYWTARHYNPEDSHLRTHRRENLKSYLGEIMLTKL